MTDQSRAKDSSLPKIATNPREISVTPVSSQKRKASSGKDNVSSKRTKANGQVNDMEIGLAGPAPAVVKPKKCGHCSKLGHTKNICPDNPDAGKCIYCHQIKAHPRGKCPEKLSRAPSVAASGGPATPGVKQMDVDPSEIQSTNMSVLSPFRFIDDFERQCAIHNNFQACTFWRVVG
jgi:hypothetical protein